MDDGEKSDFSEDVKNSENKQEASKSSKPNYKKVKVVKETTKESINESTHSHISHSHELPRSHEHSNHDSNSKSLTDVMRGNPWIVSTFVTGILLIVLLIGVFYGGFGATGKTISGDIAGEKLVEFLNGQTGGGVDYVSAEDIGNLYVITVSYENQSIPVFITKDGNYFVQGAIPLTDATENEHSNSNTNTNTPTEIIKSDKPVVELFVMTHCPYGNQAEKGIISAIENLGNTVNAKIRFVHYFMHDPEEAETPRQVCIREEQPTKWYAYLKCFLKEGDSESCLTEAKIDKTALNKCISASGKADSYYEVDSALSQSYGVQGSPTLVINGQIVNSARDSASYLKTICSAFNTEPSQCTKELSSATPSAGFGWEATGTATTASC